MVSRSAEYALRAVLHIAQAGGAAVRADAIAGAVGAPRNYLHKVLHALARTGVLLSARGPSGGFVLADRLERITLQSVVAPFDTVADRRWCILGRGECNDIKPCLAHHRWRAAADEITAFFRDTTVADVLNGNGASCTAPLPELVQSVTTANARSRYHGKSSA